MNILAACDDPNLFGRWFRNADTWRSWFVFLAGLFGLPMAEEQRELFERCTGRSAAPDAPAREAWLVVGRRGGKSFVLALVAVYLATFKDWRPYLAPGERGVVMVVATDRKQAGVIFGYIRALLQNVPMLAGLIQRETIEAIDLANGIAVEVHTASYRTIRGRTVVAGLLDELAFWRSDDSANPDREILAALRPAMATVPGAMLLCASSPYARRGVLYEAWRNHFGKPGPVLVWRAPTRVMNPTVSEDVIREAYEQDPVSAAAEFGAEFRADVETFVAREAVEACVVPGRRELPPVSGQSYQAFVDPSGGSADAMTQAIGHLAAGVAVIDALRERRPPFSPEAVVAEFAELLKTYRIATVRGDRYAGEWPRERFKVHGIHYEPAAKPKSDIYRDTLPRLNAGKVELLDDRRLVVQIAGLERRTARGGRDSIDHAPAAHDDLANAVLGVVALLDRPRSEPRIWVLGDDQPIARSGLSGMLAGPGSYYSGGDFGAWARGLR